MLVFAFLLSLRAKLSFVTFNVVQSLNLVVCLLALIVLTILLLAKIDTVVNLSCTATLIEQSMVVRTMFRVVRR